MKRATRAPTANKETHWIDELLCTILAHCFDDRSIAVSGDAMLLCRLRCVSRQMQRLAWDWLLPVWLHHIDAPLYMLMPHAWQARLHGLRSLRAGMVGSHAIECHTNLQCLTWAQWRTSDMPRFATTLRELRLSYVGVQCELSVASLVGLRKLRMDQGTRFVVLAHLSCLTNLCKLVLQHARCAPGELRTLTQLESLAITHSHWIRDGDLTPLMPQLRTLNLAHNTGITDECLAQATRLEKLNLTRSFTITEAGLHPLTQLRALTLDRSFRIGCAPLLRMPRLHTLLYTNCHTLLPEELARLTQLTRLDLYMAYEPLRRIDWLRQLTRLRELCFSPDEQITSRWVRDMSSLRRLGLPPFAAVSERAQALLVERACELYRVT